MYMVITKKFVIKCKMMILSEFANVNKGDIDELFMTLYGRLPDYCRGYFYNFSFITKGEDGSECVSRRSFYGNDDVPYNDIVRFSDFKDNVFFTMKYKMGNDGLMRVDKNETLEKLICASRLNTDLKDVLFVIFMLGIVDRYSVVEYLMDITEFSDRLIFEEELGSDRSYDRNKILVSDVTKYMMYVLAFCCAIRNYEEVERSKDDPWGMIDVLNTMFENRSKNDLKSYLYRLLKEFGFSWDYYPSNGLHFDSKYYKFIMWLFEKCPVSEDVKRSVSLNSFDIDDIEKINQTSRWGI